ncbi:MAG: DUF3524 domain-containing protein [Flavobacteriales bacterium]|nr:DUF3524 domain-containing protein [Flavobacteriales bacterium]
MKILLIEPYGTGSHLQWAEGYSEHSEHEVRLLTLPGRHWKWRMHGGAITLAEQFLACDFQPDLILATDMLDLSSFLSLTRERTASVPTAVYFHENQLTYPWSPNDEDLRLKRDNHYGFINYTSALAADRVFFNSEYHRTSFLSTLPAFLKQFPDHTNSNTVATIARKSEVLYLGMDLRSMDPIVSEITERPKRAVILWNHRWEYDKNPEEFFEALFEIQRRGWDFKLVVLGERFKNSPAIFDEAKKRLEPNILHWGFVESREEYVRLLGQCDMLPVTSYQDFFGGSVVEAMYCNVKPLLPKRLAYPEHVPELLHYTFFYETGELVDKLQRWIRDVSILRKQQTRSFVERYDWTKQIANYDDAFSKLVTSSPQVSPSPKT